MWMALRNRGSAVEKWGRINAFGAVKRKAMACSQVSMTDHGKALLKELAATYQLWKEER